MDKKMKPPGHLRVPAIIETSRLSLRPPNMADAPAIFATYAQDPLVTRYLIWRPHASLSETRAFLRRCETAWHRGSAFPWVITRRRDNRLMGMIEPQVDGHRVELGYVLARAFWGQGYMTEAAGAVVRWALDQAGIYRVWAATDLENLASARVLEKVGMEKEGVLRRWGMHPNISKEPRDCACYAIIK
jgi:ribosomal-protein-alanine N-acetyltransferase